MPGRLLVVHLLLLGIMAAGCASAPAAPTRSGPEPAAASAAPAAPRRIAAGILGNPFTLSALINSAGGDTVPGVPEVEQLVHAGLAVAGDGGLRPSSQKQCRPSSAGAGGCWTTGAWRRPGVCGSAHAERRTE
jgi:hypothetical protein